jgi:uncharacterized protein (TIGR02246 family)
MRIVAVITFCLLAARPVLFQGTAVASPAARDEAAIRAIVARYVDAREKRDATLLEALFTADADQLVTTGEWRQGRDNVVRGGLASSQANPGARQIAIEVVRFVAPGVAIADGRYEITDANAAAPRRMRTTFVVVRVAAGTPAKNDWRIAAIRNMAPTDPAR